MRPPNEDTVLSQTESRNRFETNNAIERMNCKIVSMRCVSIVQQPTGNAKLFRPI